MRKTVFYLSIMKIKFFTATIVLKLKLKFSAKIFKLSKWRYIHLFWSNDS